jgi:DNA-binding IclR family transcriptional regulator
MDKSPVQSVRKALELLDAIVAADLSTGPAALRELAGKLAMPSNSAWNLLRTLIDCGYVAQAGRGMYCPGPRIRQLGRMNQFEAPGVRRAIDDCLRAFAEAQRESAVMAILAGGARVVLTRAEPERTVTISHHRVEETGFFAKPTGRMLAAMATRSQLDRIIDHNGMPGGDWDGLDRREDLEDALAAIAREGVCDVVDEQRELFAVARAVGGDSCPLPAVVGVHAPLYRVAARRRAELLAALEDLADSVGLAVAGALPVGVTP